MQEQPGQVVDLAEYRRRAQRPAAARPGPAAPDLGEADELGEAEEIVKSMLDAMPDLTQIPPPLLREARQFCVNQLGAGLPRLRDDHPKLMQLVKEVRAALRRSVPDAFLLRAPADAGSVWSTPGANHWSVAWLHQLAPAEPDYFPTPTPGLAEQLAELLTVQLAAAKLPSSSPQAHLSHVLERIGRCIQMPEAADLLGLAPTSRPVVHAYRDVAIPLLSANAQHPRYTRLDLVIPIRPRDSGSRYDVVIVVGKRGTDDEITALEYARRHGAIAIRLAPGSVAPSLFATDLVIPTVAIWRTGDQQPRSRPPVDPQAPVVAWAASL